MNFRILIFGLAVMPQSTLSVIPSAWSTLTEFFDPCATPDTRTAGGSVVRYFQKNFGLNSQLQEELAGLANKEKLQNLSKDKRDQERLLQQMKTSSIYSRQKMAKRNPQLRSSKTERDVTFRANAGKLKIEEYAHKIEALLSKSEKGLSWPEQEIIRDAYSLYYCHVAEQGNYVGDCGDKLGELLDKIAETFGDIDALSDMTDPEDIANSFLPLAD